MDGSSFLNIGITFAIFSLSGNTPEYKTWFINSVNDLKITGSITLSNFVETPSNPQLFFVGRLFIVFLTVSSSIWSKVNVEVTFLFK